MSTDLILLFADPAHGAGAHADDGHGGGLLSDTYFWVGLGFVIFIAMIGKQAWGMIAGGLDDRSTRIAKQIDDARALREEAQKHLAEIERRNKDAQKEADAIQAQAREGAAGLLAKADEEAEALVTRKTAQVEARIAQMEAQAVAHVRAVAAEAATAAVRTVLADSLKGAAGQQALDKSIDEVGQRLH